MLLRRFTAALLAFMLILSCACAREAENIADQCAFRVSEGSAEKITDASISTGWVPGGEAPEMLMRLPDSGAAWFQVSWYKPADNFEITQYDAAQNVLSTATQSENDCGFYANLYPVAPGAKYISVKFSQGGQGINKIRVFGEGDLPRTATQWQPPHEDCELMVISTHMDDEWLWFGGIIPYYDTVLGHDVQVVYMTDCGRLRYAECMNALASAGVSTHPVFLGLKDERIDSLTKTLDHWGGQEAVTRIMVELIRSRRPEVILTHDWDGEYGHNQHIVTSRCMETVIAAAADPNLYPELGEAWQVQKLYRHLETKCPIEFDWHQSFPELDGRTLLQTAAEAMEENASQIKYFQVKDHGQYDNAKFGLSYSTVGDDLLHEDLFENVVFAAPEPSPAATPEPSPAASPEHEAEPSPEPSPADEPEATPEPEPEATSEPEPEAAPGPTPEPAPVKEKAGAGTVIAIALAAVLVGAALALVVAFVKQNAASKKKKKKRRKPVRR